MIIPTKFIIMAITPTIAAAAKSYSKSLVTTEPPTATPITPAIKDNIDKNKLRKAPAFWILFWIIVCNRNINAARGDNRQAIVTNALAARSLSHALVVSQSSILVHLRTLPTDRQKRHKPISTETPLLSTLPLKNYLQLNKRQIEKRKLTIAVRHC